MADALAIATVRLRAAPGAGSIVRLRASRQLQIADLTPGGLPPSAILVVRRLADPLPGRFGGARLRPQPEWERAVRGALQAAARSAARPSERGRLDASAPAVLFEDEAQLIACLVADRAHGRLASGWWWRSVLPRLDLSAGAAFGAGRDPGAILAAKPREAPAVLSTIARWGDTAAVAGALTIDSAQAALQSLATAHALPMALVTEWSGPRARHNNDAASRRGRPDGFGAASRESATLPWESWVPREIQRPGVPSAIQLLIGVALCLHTAPAHLQSGALSSPGQRAALRQQRRTDAGRHSGDSAAGVAPRVTGAIAGTTTGPEIATARREMMATGDSAAVSTRTGAAAGPGRHAGAGSDGASTPGRAPVLAVPGATMREQTVPLAHAEHEALGMGGESGSAPGASTPPARALTRQARSAGTAAPVDVPALTLPALPDALATSGAETRLGGVFYLIPVLDRLELPGAFDPTWSAGRVAGSWGTLDLIARALLGTSFAKDDALWHAFGQLACWGHDPPRRFRSQIADGASDPPWIAPPAWLEELRDPLDRAAWSHAGSRVCLWSPAGYLLTHRRTRGHAEAAARRARRRYDPGASTPDALVRRPVSEVPWMPPSMLPAGCPPRLGRWAAAAAPAVLRRLRLGLGDDAACAADLLRVPARLYVTSSHVDVVFALGDINLPVRRAGLDRNPGWLPGFGRVVYFHFE